MNKYFFLILFFTVSVFAQRRNAVYRIASGSYSTVAYSYWVSVLYLQDDSYRLLSQKYNSKKMARKNVLMNSNDEYGKWKMSGDTLILENNEKKQPMKFLVIDEKRIAYLFHGNEPSDSYWRKVNTR